MQGSTATVCFKNKMKFTGPIETIDSAKFTIRDEKIDSVITIYPDSLKWIAAGKNRGGINFLGRLGPKLMLAGVVYATFGLVNGLIGHYDLKVIMPKNLKVAGIIAGTGALVTTAYLLGSSKRSYMGKWKLRLNDYSILKGPVSPVSK